VLALQELVAHCRPAFDDAELVTPEAVARVYQAKLGALRHEVLLAVALDGRNRIIGEFELTSGGRHSTSLTPSDVFRPLIRAGASSFVLVHNHPSGDPKPSADDVKMTCVIRMFGHGLGIVLHDHIVVTADGHTSLLDQGFLEETDDETRSTDQAVQG
jgi:DNA repair protein RadC